MLMMATRREGAGERPWLCTQAERVNAQHMQQEATIGERPPSGKWQFGVVFPDCAGKTKRSAVQRSAAGTQVCRNSAVELASRLCGEGD